MGDMINKEFEEFQKQLEIKSKKLKKIVSFETGEDIDKVLTELKEKKVVL